MLASSDGSLDVTAKSGTLTQARLPLRRRGAPAGLEKIPSGWFSWDWVSNARRLAYIERHESWTSHRQSMKQPMYVSGCAIGDYVCAALRCAVVVVLVVVQCLEFCWQCRNRRHRTKSWPSAPALGSAAPAATRGWVEKSDGRDRGSRLDMH